MPGKPLEGFGQCLRTCATHPHLSTRQATAPPCPSVAAAFVVLCLFTVSSFSVRAEQLPDRPAADIGEDSRRAFAQLQQSCAAAAPSLDRMRDLVGLDLCLLYEDYQRIVDRLRDNRGVDVATVEPVINMLLGSAILGWEAVAPRFATSWDRKPEFRILAPRIASTLSASQRLRWVATLLLVDRFVDRNLLTFIDNGVAVEQAIRGAVGPTGYVYVDFDAALVGPFDTGEEWEKATARRAVFQRGVAAFSDPETATHVRLSDSDLEEGRRLADPAALSQLLSYLGVDVTEVITGERSNRGSILPIAPLLRQQYEAVGEFIVEQRWEEAQEDLVLRPIDGVLTAAGDFYQESVSEVCRQRIGDVDGAWAVVESIAELSSLSYEQREQFRKTILVPALAATSACSHGALLSAFRAAVDREYTSRLLQVRDNMRATYGNLWHRELWVASRVISTIGYEGQLDTLRTQYESTYDARADDIEAFLRTMEERDAAHARQMAEAMAETKGELAKLNAETERLRISGEIELEKVVEQATLSYMSTWEEMSAKRFESSESTRRMLGVARIEGASEEKIAEINAGHEYRIAELEAEREEKLATIEAELRIALSEDDVEAESIRRQLEREIALIEERKAVTVAEIRAGRGSAERSSQSGR